MAQTAVAPVTSGSAIFSLVRQVAVAGIAGVVTGVIIGGVGGRIVMRVSAIAAPDRVTGTRTENGFRIGDISLGGTLELVIFVGIFSGMVGAICYVITEPWLAWAGRWRGLVFGSVLLLIASPLVLDTENFDFVILRPRELNIAMFSALFLAFGVLMVWMRATLERWLPQAAMEGPVTVGRLNRPGFSGDSVH